MYTVIAVDEHWKLFRIMQMAVRTMAHPLSQLIADPAGHTIASFRAQTPTFVRHVLRAFDMSRGRLDSPPELMENGSMEMRVTEILDSMEMRARMRLERRLVRRRQLAVRPTMVRPAWWA